MCLSAVSHATAVPNAFTMAYASAVLRGRAEVVTDRASGPGPCFRCAPPLTPRAWAAHGVRGEKSGPATKVIGITPGPRQGKYRRRSAPPSSRLRKHYGMLYFRCRQLYGLDRCPGPATSSSPPMAAGWPAARPASRRTCCWGDFDSLGAQPRLPNVLRVPVEKDDTDTMLAVKTGLERGETEFDIPASGRPPDGPHHRR
ncbi:MAG: hypothetical protein V8S97_06375 [Oscillospiraceae bacterium]